MSGKRAARSGAQRQMTPAGDGCWCTDGATAAFQGDNVDPPIPPRWAPLVLAFDDGDVVSARP